MEKMDTCWNWKGQTTAGYPVALVGPTPHSQRVSAARIAFEQVRGVTLGSEQLRVRCGNRLCVNPDHMTGGAQEAELLAIKFRRYFDQRINKTPSCWLWEGSLDSDGYGRATAKGGPSETLAHRIAWTFANGPVPDGLSVCHRCDVPACVNPAHLFVGTSQDNQADKVQKNRQARGSKNGAYRHNRGAAISDGVTRWHKEHPEKTARGEHHKNSKLNEEKVRKIRILVEEGFSQSEIAVSLGIAQASVSRVVTGQCWSHVK